MQLDDRQPRPGEVTALRRGRRGKILLVIEGREPLEVSRETLAAFPVREGEVLAEPDLQRLAEDELRLAARSRAMRFLETRERSVAEVRLRLRRYGYADGLVENTLGYLVDLGFVDDRRFALAYAREKLRSGWGERRIQAELSQKGVDRPLAAEVVAELIETDPGSPACGVAEEGPSLSGLWGAGEGSDLVALVERRFGREFLSDRVRAERRAAAFLARRGHDWERIDRVLRQVRARTSGDEL